MAAHLARRPARLALLLALAAAAGCTSGPLRQLAQPRSPYDGYRDSLRTSGLDQTALGRDWVQAGAAALTNAAATTLPLHEVGFFTADRPTALAYQLQLERGRVLRVDAAFESTQPGRLFVDLFEVRPGAAPTLEASLGPDAMSLTHEIDRSGTYVLRVQPELLRGGRVSVVQRSLSSLAFPLPGLTAKTAQSFFGAARDAGARNHEGIDIFAPRGTAAVAVADGTAQPSTNTLGGNVVWLHDRRRGTTYYYAHLDRWAFTEPATVRAGDVVGYVGNTGNARTTPPHLHFGIYARGAIDPLPFVRADDAAPRPPSAADTDKVNTIVRTTGAGATLRAGPGNPAAGRPALARDTVMRVVAATPAALRVVLPDGTEGYLPAGAVTSTSRPLRRLALADGAVVRDHPSAQAAPLHVLRGGASVDVLGRFGAFTLVKLASGPSGWVDTAGI